MSAPVLTSISPAFGAPGAAITLTGSGFNSAARVGCPVLVETTFVDSTSLTATIPEDIAGPDGGEMAIGVFVLNPDGLSSAAMSFVVKFPRRLLETWTDIDSVCGEVPGFERGGNVVSDRTLYNWMRSIAQTVAGTMARRSLSLDPADWTPADASSALPNPAGVLEQLVRLGAAARLAATIGAQFSQSGEWALAKNLRDAYAAELSRLDKGDYDKIFNPNARTEETGQLAAGGNALTCSGGSTQTFSKGQVF